MAAGAARLGIDFGTSTTVAVVAFADREPRPLLFDGSPLLPSAICVDASGRLIVGRDALHLALAHPSSFEPNPKRRVDEGTVLLGAEEVPVTTLFSAVLARAVDEAASLSDQPLAEVVIACPAAWGPQRRQVLLDAAPPGTRLVDEPVAAAHYFADIAGHRVPEGGTALVYDFGAGTFDASVVRQTGSGFRVLATLGLDDTGGLDVDAAIVDHLHATVTDRDGLWERLTAPQDARDRRAGRQLWDNVRGAKEMLSRSTSTLIHLPLFDIEVPVGREELDRLADPVLERTVATSREVLALAEVPIGELTAVFLAGGSSRMPAVATALHRALDLAPVIVDQPELAVAEGSLRSATGSALATGAADLPGESGGGGGVPDGWPTAAPEPLTTPALVKRLAQRRLAVAATVALIVLVGTAAAAAWRSKPHGTAAAATSPSSSPAAVRAASPRPSPSPSVSVAPGLDPCLIGTWKSTSRTSIISIESTKQQFTSPGGETQSFDAIGRSFVNYDNSQPLTAEINGAHWVETFRGMIQASYQIVNGAVVLSGFHGTGSWLLTKNGRRNNSSTFQSLGLEPENYKCAGDTLHQYGSSNDYAVDLIKIGPPPPN